MVIRARTHVAPGGPCSPTFAVSAGAHNAGRGERLPGRCPLGPGIDWSYRSGFVRRARRRRARAPSYIRAATLPLGLPHKVRKMVSLVSHGGDGKRTAQRVDKDPGTTHQNKQKQETAMSETSRCHSHAQPLRAPLHGQTTMQRAADASARAVTSCRSNRPQRFAPGGRTHASTGAPATPMHPRPPCIAVNQSSSSGKP